jgi:hypothetical protein
MSSTRASKQQERNQAAAKRQENSAPTNRNARPQICIPRPPAPPGESEADSLFVPQPKQKKKNPVDFS